MKVKKPSFWVLVTMFVLLALLLVSTGAASASLVPDNHYAASGVWTVPLEEWNPPKVVGVNHDNANLKFTGVEWGVWEGTFRGTSEEPFAGGSYRNGTSQFIIWVYFTGSVYTEDDVLLGTGDVVIRVDLDADSEGMGGRWTVAHGSGGLKQLHGMGTWVYLGPGELGAMSDYSGEVWLN